MNIYKDKEKLFKGGTMKRIYIVASIATCLIFSLYLLGCGGSGPGSPGSSGSEDTGVVIHITTATHSDPAGDQGDMWLIDLYMSDCDGEDEEWGDDYMHFTLATIPIYDTSLQNVFLYLTHYRVTYDPLSPQYPPIDEIRGGAQGAIQVLPYQVSGPFSIMILDFGRKYDIQDLLARGVYPGDFPLLYNMTVELFGQDQYGQEFSITPYVRIVEIAPYNKCG